MSVRIGLTLGLLLIFLWLAPGPIEWFSDQGERTTPGKSLAQNGDRVRIRVVDAHSRKPVGGALVSFRLPGLRVQSARSSPTGEVAFSFLRLPPYPYRLRIGAKDFESIDWRVRGDWLQSSEVNEVGILPSYARADLRFRLHSDQDENVGLRWSWRMKGRGLLPKGETGEECVRLTRGFLDYQVSSVPIGAHFTLTATGLQSGAGQRIACEVEANQPKVERSMTRKDLKGRIEDRNGRALFDVLVRYVFPQAVSESEAFRCRTDNLGCFRLSIPAWIYRTRKKGFPLGYCDLVSQNRLDPERVLMVQGDHLQAIQFSN